MRLYEIEKGSKIYGLVPIGNVDGVVIFDHLDGMYSYCYIEGQEDKTLHLSASTPLRKFMDGYEIADETPVVSDKPAYEDPVMGHMHLSSEIDIGEEAVCDSCNDSYTKENPGPTDRRSMLFGSYALCPDCAERWHKKAHEYNEADHIVEVSKPGETYWEFVMRLRGGDNTIKFYTGGGE